jgi:hypothetical protein
MAKRTYPSEEKAETAHEKAAWFKEYVLHDPEGADAIRAESLDDWLSRTKRRIVEKNPRRLMSSHIVGQTARREARKMGKRETRLDIEADRDELLDKVEELRDLADDILSDYEPEELEEEESEDSVADDSDDDGDL